MTHAASPADPHAAPPRSARASHAPTDGEPWWWLALFAALLLLLRFAVANLGRFTEGDDISIAAGVAALHRDSPGDAYRYGVQVGYYHLVSWLTGVLGGRLLTIPDVMVWLSIVAGVVIPVAGVRAFRDELTRGERWLVGALLVANPIIWQASRYGNTAIISVALTVVAATILSNRPQRTGEALAMACFAGAMFERADAVLATGGLFALLWRTHRAIVRAAVPLALCGGVVAGAYAALVLFDPRMGDVVGAVAQHSINPISTRFLEYFLFGVSPVPLLMAAAGARDLQRGRAMLLAVIGAWVVPFVAFYFTNTTTPRYLMQLMPPLAIASSVGVLGSLAAAGWRRVASQAVVFPLVFAHLFVGLSDFSPAKRRSWLTDAVLPSDDGPVFTGALLYKSFVMRPPAERVWWRPRRFAPWNEVERSLVLAFDTLRTGSRRGKRIALITNPSYGNEAHYFAQVAEVEIAGQEPGMAFNRLTRTTLGGATITMAGARLLAESKRQLPAAAGDEVWGLFPSRAVADSLLRPLVAPGLVLRPQPDWPSAQRLWRYTVEPGS